MSEASRQFEHPEEPDAYPPLTPILLEKNPELFDAVEALIASSEFGSVAGQGGINKVAFSGTAAQYSLPGGMHAQVMRVKTVDGISKAPTDSFERKIQLNDTLVCSRQRDEDGNLLESILWTVSKRGTWASSSRAYAADESGLLNRSLSNLMNLLAVVGPDEITEKATVAKKGRIATMLGKLIGRQRQEGS